MGSLWQQQVTFPGSELVETLETDTINVPGRCST